MRAASIISVTILLVTSGMAAHASAEGSVRILLIAGETAKVDTVGHHDYLAGCECLRVLLEQTDDVEAVRVNDGWPQDESVFDGVRSVVFYTDGGGKQAFLSSPERIAKVQALVDAGVGIVMIHQAVDYPDEFIDRAKSWLGGVYQTGKSGRGHWDSEHADFPEHPVTRGVTSWEINDGWLNGIQFVSDMKGIVPLVWSGKEYVASREGLDHHIVCWTYDRPDGGRSFSFTGLDAHSAWERTGMRQLVLNGVLWSAGVDIPRAGASSKLDQSQLEAMLTPRTPKPKKAAKTSVEKQAVPASGEK
ncbi:MAG: ThuA domain-containing protein [Planctomycetaceae bacterium]